MNQRGFTLIELIVVIAILTIIAGILVIPNVIGATERSRVAIANTDVSTAQQAIDAFSINNGELPNRKDATVKNYYTLLFTGIAADGTALTTVKMENKQGSDQSQTGVLDITDFLLVKRDNLYYHLIVNDRSYPDCKDKKNYGWCESYLKLKGDMLDPWGNSYLIFFIDQGDDTVRVFILSAGSDKALNTDPAADVIINPDDVGTTWIAKPSK